MLIVTSEEEAATLQSLMTAVAAMIGAVHTLADAYNPDTPADTLVPIQELQALLGPCMRAGIATMDALRDVGNASRIQDSYPPGSPEDLMLRLVRGEITVNSLRQTQPDLA